MKNVSKEIDYDSLQVDKENDSVLYNDEFHKYWRREDKQTCISCTTLIHNYTQPFDSAFWSKYKALEALLSKEEFGNYRTDLNSSKRWKEEYLTGAIERFNISLETFNNKVDEILAEWDKKNKDACERGTAIHKFHELQALGGNVEPLSYLKLGGKFGTRTDNKIVEGKEVYPELLLSYMSPDGKIKLAGQADLVIVDGWDVYMLDFKTNKEIKMKSFFDRRTGKSVKMLMPLNNIDDTNFWHYTLQLSLYCYMIQQIDPRFNIKGLTLIHIDHNNNTTFLECEYLKSDIENMLEHYKKQVKNDARKQANKALKF